mgnify:FL=1
MPLHAEGITDAVLDEAIAFVRSANPFAQYTWGWNTGRFIDWRWAGNAVRNPDPAWFAEHGTIFRDGDGIRAISVAEYGEDDACILTRDEDPGTVAEIIPLLADRHHARGEALNLEFAESTEWLRTVCADAGMTEEPGTGCEWEYDLERLPEARPLPEGFTLSSIAETGDDAYDGIAECITAAFNAVTDPRLVLRSLEDGPMYEPELSVIALDPGGRVAAYCRGEADPDNGVGGIDPVCTHPDFHRKGLGGAVVVRCLESQQRLGGRFSYIGSEPEPAPGARLYRSLGPSSVSVSCTWSLPAPAE